MEYWSVTNNLSELEIRPKETSKKRQNNGSDFVNYLREKSEAKFETIKSELQLKTKELQLQHERTKYNDQLSKKLAIINTKPATNSFNWNCLEDKVSATKCNIGFWDLSREEAFAKEKFCVLFFYNFEFIFQKF